jgi:hypothetical protein
MLTSRDSCLQPRFSGSVSLARSMNGRSRLLLVHVILLFVPVISSAQPPGGPPKPVPVISIPRPPAGHPQPVTTPSPPRPMEFTTSAWHAVAGSTFETAHPYGNNLTVWREVYLPAGATKLRLLTVGMFELENNYDFLEVWKFQSSEWVLVKRYTGTVSPSLTEEFVGRYFQLKLATDPTVVWHGFKVLAQYRN